MSHSRDDDHVCQCGGGECRMGLAAPPAPPVHNEQQPQLCDCPLCAGAPRPTRELIYVVLAVILGLSVVGYFFGMTQPAPARPAWTREVAAPPGDVPPAVPYDRMDARRCGPNGDWLNHLDKLASDKPDLLAPVPAQTEAQKSAALALRASRRAYDGAPPTVPHPIVQHSAASCLACHADGLRVGDRVASKISHPHYASCTQCHVESDNRNYPAGGPLTDNAFAGLASPDKGQRAWPGAPPTIPHPTLMRNDCMSCHGPTGPSGLRSTHPWRTNCTQCHAPSAEMNQQPVPPSAAAGGTGYQPVLPPTAQGRQD